jgi:hypothetical protein
MPINAIKATGDELHRVQLPIGMITGGRHPPRRDVYPPKHWSASNVVADKRPADAREKASDITISKVGGQIETPRFAHASCGGRSADAEEKRQTSGNGWRHDERLDAREDLEIGTFQ